MAIIKPFKGIRPDTQKAPLVAALPYDVMNTDEARDIASGNPYSFLHVDKAEIDLDANIHIYDDSVYAKAHENLTKMIEDKTLIQDENELFYIYRLTWKGNSQTGLVVCTSIDEYLDGTIKKHELTRADKEADRIRHVDILNANTGPIFLAYKENKDIALLLNNWIAENSPVYDFVQDDVNQTVWVINDSDIIYLLIDKFKSIKNLYIADGHHRNASAVKVGLMRREEMPNYTGLEEFNYYLSVLFSKDELKIMDYNRLVKDLNGLTPNEFLNALSEKFVVTACEKQEFPTPRKPHEFGMYLDNNWYKLTSKSSIIKNDAVDALDVSILQNELLAPLLSIGDPRTDKRIDFVGGIRGLKELEKRVDSKEMAVAFLLFPTSMEELMTVADSNKTMPPKSTWFEPKLRSGLFIHSLKN